MIGNLCGSTSTLKPTNTAFSPIVTYKNFQKLRESFHQREADSVEKQASRNNLSDLKTKLNQKTQINLIPLISIFDTTSNMLLTKIDVNIEKMKSCETAKDEEAYSHKLLEKAGNNMISAMNKNQINVSEGETLVNFKPIVFPKFKPTFYFDSSSNLDHDLGEKSNEKEENADSSLLAPRLRKKKKKIRRKNSNKVSELDEISSSLIIKKTRKTRKKNPDAFLSLEEPRRSHRKKAPSSSAEEEEKQPQEKKIFSRRGRKSKIPKNYSCKICRKRFVTPSALGGHTSKAHPGESIDYKEKLKVREENESNRNALVHARREFFKSLGFNYEEFDREDREKINFLIKKHKRSYYANLNKFKLYYMMK